MSIKNICDKGNLFQVPINNDIIKNWEPLECNKSNPRNCGPTAIALTSIKSKKSAEKYTQQHNIDELGTTYPQMLKLIQTSLTRELIDETEFQPI